MKHADQILLKGGRGDRPAFDRYISDLVSEPLWSPTYLTGRRIPFKAAKEAKGCFENEFGSPGCYLHGVRDQILYVGRTTKKLWTRLRGRYFIGAKTQHGWAVAYEQQLIERGIDGFPRDVVDVYKRQYGGSTVRLEGAVAFARAGVNDVWFHILPTSSSDKVLELEPILIDYCNAWNESRGFDRMLNLRFR